MKWTFHWHVSLPEDSWEDEEVFFQSGGICDRSQEGSRFPHLVCESGRGWSPPCSMWLSNQLPSSLCWRCLGWKESGGFLASNKNCMEKRGFETENAKKTRQKQSTKRFLIWLIVFLIGGNNHHLASGRHQSWLVLGKTSWSVDKLGNLSHYLQAFGGLTPTLPRWFCHDQGSHYPWPPDSMCFLAAYVQRMWWSWSTYPPLTYSPQK